MAQNAEQNIIKHIEIPDFWKFLSGLTIEISERQHA